MLGKKSREEKLRITNLFMKNFHTEMKMYIDANRFHERIIVENFCNPKDLNLNEDIFKVKDTANSQSPLVANELISLNESNVACLGIAHILQAGLFSDITIQVGKESFLCHKDVLCARSPYFSAMLEVSGRWSEAQSDKIILSDVSAKSFAIFLCFLYGVFIEWHCTSVMDTSNLVQVSDMLCFQCLKNIVCYFLKKDLCHFFHKPCAGCTEGVLSVLVLSERYSMNELYGNCCHWCRQFSVRIWPTRKFCGLPVNIHKHIFKLVEDSLCLTNVIDKTLEMDNIFGRLTDVSWTRPVVDMTDRLMLKCIRVIREFIYQLASSKKICPLFQGFGGKRNLHEEISHQIVTDLNIGNACRLYKAVKIIHAFVSEDQWNPLLMQTFKLIAPDIKDSCEYKLATLYKSIETLVLLEKRITSFILNNYFAIIHTDDWIALLSNEERQEFKSTTLCEGDPSRKPKPRPVLSSSKKLSDSTGDSKNKNTTPTKRIKKFREKKKKSISHQDNSNPFLETSSTSEIVLTDRTKQQNTSCTFQRKSSDIPTFQPCIVVSEEVYEEICILPTVLKPYSLQHKPFNFTVHN